MISGDTLTIHLENVAVADEFAFLGTIRVPSSLSFNITYTKSGQPRKVRPTSRDPLSAFHWAGEMWMATNSGTFSASHNDGSFSAQGSFSSSGQFGEMGTERNGVFLDSNDLAATASAASTETAGSVQSAESANLSPSIRGRAKRLF